VTAPDLADALAGLGSATLGESGGRPMRARIRPAWPGASVAAPATTVQCTPADNLAIHVAVANAAAGTVLVVNVGDERELGYWGEVLTTGAQARGIAGLVIDGCVRDIDALQRLGFPVFSTGIALPGASKKQPGRVGGLVRVGDVEVGQGDWLVADADGVTVVAAASVDTVLAAGNARAAKESRLFTELKNGNTTIELLGLDPSVIEHGGTDD
jgi:4-hydroxy-4-methyl-2-oxoglutarate aldolase